MYFLFSQVIAQVRTLFNDYYLDLMLLFASPNKLTRNFQFIQFNHGWVIEDIN